MIFAWFAAIIIIALIATIVVTLLVARTMHDNKTSKRKRAALKAALVSGTLVVWTTIGLGFSQLVIASHHGCSDWDISFEKIIEYNQLTPTSQALPNDLAGTIIVLFRYDCTDCHDIWPELKDFLENDNTYAISSRTEQGEALCELFGIEAVPSAIYFGHDATGEHDTKKLLYTVDDEKHVIFDYENANRLLELQAKGE